MHISFLKIWEIQSSTPGLYCLQACLRMILDSSLNESPPREFVEQLRKGIALSGPPTDMTKTSNDEIVEGWTPFFLRQRQLEGHGSLSLAPSMMERTLSTMDRALSTSSQEARYNPMYIHYIENLHEKTSPLELKIQLQKTVLFTWVIKQHYVWDDSVVRSYIHLALCIHRHGYHSGKSMLYKYKFCHAIDDQAIQINDNYW